MKQNWIRILCWIISVICARTAYYYHEYIVNDSKHLNDFSYIGTVATFIGLIIAVSEIIHSLNISKSIQEEAKIILEKVSLIESASGISDCLAAIDDVNQNIASEDYKSALKSFQYFRKIYVKVTPRINGNNELSSLGEIELFLQKSTHTSLSAPLAKKQKTELIKDILLLKQELEKINPARVPQNVTH